MARDCLFLGIEQATADRDLSKHVSMGARRRLPSYTWEASSRRIGSGGNVRREATCGLKVGRAPQIGEHEVRPKSPDIRNRRPPDRGPGGGP